MLSIALVYRPLWEFKRNIGHHQLTSMQWLHRKSPCFHPLVTRDHNRETAYLGESWPFWFRRVGYRANVRIALSTGTRMGNSGDPEQLVSIQHIKGVLVGARKGQRADIQWILKWLKLYIKCMVFLFKSVQVGTTNSDFLTHLLLHTTGVKTFYRFSFQNSSPQF